MKSFPFIAVAAILGVAFGALFSAKLAFSHSKMFESIPPTMASVGEGLDTLVLKFDRKVRLTVVEMTRGEHPIALEFPRGFVTKANVSFEKLEVGCYDWSWIAVARDGHVMEGVGQFEVVTTPGEYGCAVKTSFTEKASG